MTTPFRIFVLTAISLIAFPSTSPAAWPEVVQQWTFNQDGQLRGWSAGGHIKEARVEDDALRGRSVDWDPIFLGPVFEIQASPSQYLEVRMRCQRTSWYSSRTAQSDRCCSAAARTGNRSSWAATWDQCSERGQGGAVVPTAT